MVGIHCWRHWELTGRGWGHVYTRSSPLTARVGGTETEVKKNTGGMKRQRGPLVQPPGKVERERPSFPSKGWQEDKWLQQLQPWSTAHSRLIPLTLSLTQEFSRSHTGTYSSPVLSFLKWKYFLLQKGRISTRLRK